MVQQMTDNFWQAEARASLELSCRQLALTITDSNGAYLSKSTVYRVLKKAGLIKPAEIIGFKAAKEYRRKTKQPNELWDARDEMKAKFAELFDLHATIHPDGSLNGYHVDLAANIPLEMEGNNPGAYDMVFTPSRGGLKG